MPEQFITLFKSICTKRFIVGLETYNQFLCYQSPCHLLYKLTKYIKSVLGGSLNPACLPIVISCPR